MSDPKKQKGIPKALFYTALVFLLLVFFFSAGSLLKYCADSCKSQAAYNELKGLKGDYTRPPLATASPQGTGSTASTGEPGQTDPPGPELTTVTHPETGEAVQLLPELAEVYLRNPDLVGWIQIEGTKLDYPVVQRPENIDYYLNRNFDREYDAHGCIYAREVCDIAKPSDNITLYGHHMNDGSMFAVLEEYRYKSFWREHPYIYFDTLTEYHTYEIICVFRTTASVGQGFAYHEFVDAQDKVAFNTFMANCQKNAFYDTGLTASLGDKLISLSTCEYSQTNGRLVVVARRID